MAHPIPFAGPQFVVHTKSGEVPVMAGCTQCAQKLFTPATLLKDALGAGEYLRAKFDSHDCQLQSKRRRWLPSEHTDRPHTLVAGLWGRVGMEGHAHVSTCVSA